MQNVINSLPIGKVNKISEKYNRNRVTNMPSILQIEITFQIPQLGISHLPLFHEFFLALRPDWLRWIDPIYFHLNENDFISSAT